MTPYEAYKLYLALKNHFTTKYDYFRYNGKVKVDGNSFDTRKDKYLFQKLAKHKDPQNLIVSNMVDRDCSWVGDLFTPEAQDCYTDWLKRQQSLSYIFKNDLDRLLPDFDSNFIVKSGQHPPLLKLYLQRKIGIETLIILQDIIGFFKHWNKCIDDTIIWPGIYTKTQKYKPFIRYDISKFKSCLRDQFLTA